MGDKIHRLMDAHRLSRSKLAEKLGVNPAVISHILSGRNKPSCDLLQKIFRQFPEINPDWLLLDSPEMYRKGMAPNQYDHDTKTENDSTTQPELAMPMDQRDAPQSDGDIAESLGMPEFPIPGQSSGIEKSDIEKIVIFYTDQTFESYTPKKKTISL